MRKLAGDAVCRIFDQLSNLDDKTIIISEDFILACFLKGNSEFRYELKAAAQQRTLALGREISTEEKTFKSSSLFEKPTAVISDQAADYRLLFSSSGADHTKYLYRHAFEHEIKTAVHQQLMQAEKRELLCSMDQFQPQCLIGER